ncbi:MAG: biopolymer transporter ExbD [bacterium]
MFRYKRPVRKAKLNIAPLLDMIFILLIFFVVSTTFSKLPGVDIQRPKSQTSDPLPASNLLIGISSKGEFYIHQRRYRRDALKEKLALKRQQNPKLSVVLVADKDSAVKYMIQVMDICKQVDIQQVAVAEELVK